MTEDDFGDFIVDASAAAAQAAIDHNVPMNDIIKYDLDQALIAFFRTIVSIDG